jgi:hypothetical protein
MATLVESGARASAAEAAASVEAGVIPPAYAALDAAYRFVKRFVQVEEGHEDDLATLVLWIAHCHAIDAFDRTGRLRVTSTLPGSGKSFILDLCALMGPEGTGEIIDPTAAGLYARTDTAIPILIDETENLWRPDGKPGPAKRQAAIVNAGYRRTRDGGPYVERKIGGELVKFGLFCPIAMAGIGRLPDTTASRCFNIHMAPGDGTREKFIPRDHEGQAVEIGAMLAQWAADYGTDVGCALPEMPPGVIGRPSEIWDTLLRVAAVAGVSPETGSWPDRCAAAAIGAVAGAAVDKSPPMPSPALAIGDVRTVWTRHSGHMAHLMSTRAALDALRAMDNRPWSGYLEGAGGARKLASLLSVTPKRLRPNGTDAPVACYMLADLPDVPDVPDAASVPAGI